LNQRLLSGKLKFILKKKEMSAPKFRERGTEKEKLLRGISRKTGLAKEEISSFNRGSDIKAKGARAREDRRKVKTRFEEK